VKSFSNPVSEPPGGPAQTPALAQASRCRIIAHRGASRLAPENTLAAARLAWELGSDGVEVDLRLSRDGHLVALHDATTHRTTDGAHDVGALTFRELRQLNAAARHGEEPGPFEPIPSLRELLSIVPPGGQMVLEIKDNVPELLPPLELEICRSGLGEKQIVLATFDHAFAAQTRRRLPRHPVLWLSWEYHNVPPDAWPELTRSLIARTREAGLDGLDVGACHDYTPAEFFPHLRRIRSAGLKLYVWTVNEPDKARGLWSLPVDGITTDAPERLLEALPRRMAGAGCPIQRSE